MELDGANFHFAASAAVKASVPQGFQENVPSNLPAGIQICFETDDGTAAFAEAVEAGATHYAEPKVIFRDRPWPMCVTWMEF